MGFLVDALAAKRLGDCCVSWCRTPPVGRLVNPLNLETPRRAADATAAAQKLGLQLEVVHAATPSDIDKSFAGLAERRVEALLIGAEATLRRPCTSK